MLGVMYMVLAVLAGRELAGGFLFPEKTGSVRKENENFCWVFWPASLAFGTLVLTWMTYAVSYLAGAVFGSSRPLFYGNLVAMGCVLIWLGALYGMRFRRSQKPYGYKRLPGIKNPLEKTDPMASLLFLFLLIFLTWIMFYMFHIKNGVLYSGFTVYGDYAPHTAMMRSFSMGNNFPTQYPHYGGADVKYHFMFQFLAGNLEYLGIRMDFAYNLISVLFLLGFLMMLYALAARITGKRAAGVGTVVLFFFRSGTAFFLFAAEHFKAGDLWAALQENTAFIGYTPNENWGLWNFNVYLNQRHLALGMVVVCTAIWVYLDWLEWGDRHTEKGLRWLKERWFTKEAWISKDCGRAIAVGALMGLCAFWNGAAVIGGLLILMGFAVFSDSKIDYVLTALCAVVLTLCQTRFFIKESAMSFSFYWGFLAEDKSLIGVLWYLFLMSGIFFLGLGFVALFLKRRDRSLLMSFMFPVFFAFCISLTPDINVNHKYIMIAYAFVAIFWADAVTRLFKRGWVLKLGALAVVVCLISTGIYDFWVILRGNDEGHRVGVNMESSLTKWMGENLDSKDLVLTPEYSMNEITMSGAMMYCGWPYYAWSAGYDTNYRASVAAEIYTAAEREAVRSLIKQEGITYIVFEEDMTFEQKECREDVIAGTYPLVYTSDNQRIRVYEVYED